MTEIIDQYNGDPVYANLHVLTRDFPLARELLKTAAFDQTKESVESLPSTAFAWEDERRFPIHTREDTLASIFYRSKLGSKVPATVDARLDLARDIYQLQEPVFARMGKEAAAPGDFALPEEQRLPLNSPGQVKVAEEVLQRDYANLSLDKRADAFSRLYQAAQAKGVELQPFSLRMAGATMSRPRIMRDWLEARAEATASPVHKDAYTKLAAAADKMPALVANRKDLVKMASTVAQLDKQAGLDKYYDKKILDPLLMVFNTEKLAEETCDVAGMPVPCSTLMQLPADIWEQLGTPEIAQVAAAQDPAAFQQIFSTLPLDVKMVLREQLAHG